MRYRVALRRVIRLGAAALALGGLLWLLGWRPNFDRSIVVSERVVRPPLFFILSIENGSAFDKAAVDVEGYKKVVLSNNAEVRRGGAGTKLQIYMEKVLSFGGWPPERMSIRDARKNMGCAVKAEGDALVIATYGEWDSHIEGGTRMRLVAIVPERLDVEQRGGLSGENSAGREWDGVYLTKPADAKGGYWYGPASPAGGWSAVPDEPDPDRTAKAPG